MSKTLKYPHTFAICAYGQSPHLEECIASLENQSIRSRVIMCTATPNEHIAKMADKHGIGLFVRNGSPNICDDWNFALSNAESDLVTLAHQDDLYESDYAEEMLKLISQADHPLIFFSDYSELRGDEIVFDTRLLNVKRKMLAKLVNKDNWGDMRIRRRALSMGSPICCPSVTFSLKNLKSPVFNKGFSGNLDWDAWERISKIEGDFVYSPKRLMQHRIHEGSETTKLIRDNVRTREDLEMFRRFWPGPIARIINLAYSSAQKSN